VAAVITAHDEPSGMSFIFPDLEAWDATRQAVSFPACMGGRAILCSITAAALHRHFGCDAVDPLACFRVHRHEVEGEALRLLCLNRLEPDGSLIIRATDVADAVR
jgi:hypothetical protein